MSPPTNFTSTLGPTITRYLSLRDALGRKGDQDRWVFGHLDSFMVRQEPSDSDLNADAFARWCITLEHMSSGVRRNRMRIVRNLCLYRRRTEPDCFVPDRELFPPEHQRVRPYIFTPAEIDSLLVSADSLKPVPFSSLRPLVYRLAIVLLYTCGLRREELVRLVVGDYDPREQTLLVRASKFHKSRLLPLSSDTVYELESFLSHRAERGIPVSASSPLLWHEGRRRHGYVGAGLACGLRRLLDRTRIRTDSGFAPRVHDFRHTFAVHVLLRWYRAGNDVQGRLPHLAAYMGHVSIVSTEYYLPFVEALANLANERFARCYGSLVVARNPDGDRP